VRKIRWEFKVLTVLALFLMLTLAAIATAEASGSCPPKPGDGPGAVRCGHLTCDRLVVNASYQGGGVCQYNHGFTCCVNGQARITTVEGVPAGTTVRLVKPNGKPFANLPGAVHMIDPVDGSVILRGVYARGEFRWNNGTVSEDAATCSP